MEKTGLIEYSVRTNRPFAGALGTLESYDVLPCEVEISATFQRGKDALAFERKVRDMLEPE